MSDSGSEPPSTNITKGHDYRSGESGEFGLAEMLIPAISHADLRAMPCHRLNLVIGGISRRNTFGGNATALRFGMRMFKYFQYARIVVIYEKESEFEPDAWDGWSVSHETPERRSIVFLGDRKISLAIGAHDVFIATFWTSVPYIRELMQRQAVSASEVNRRFVYFIQDYEPAFYPFSAPQYLADETYSRRDDTIAVFNTRQLAEYFERIGKEFQRSYQFDPRLNPGLARVRSTLTATEKEQLILFYARTQNHRNGLNLIIEGLSLWAEQFPNAREWTVLSAGDRHPDINLGNGVIVRSCGKLSMEDYGSLMSRAWVGIFFQFTPHPGYVSHEMAEFGMRVLTNRFEGRDVSEMSPGIVALESLYPQSIATALDHYCREYAPHRTSAFPNPQPVFRGGEEEFPFAQALVKDWVGDDPDTEDSVQEFDDGNSDGRLSIMGKQQMD